MLTYSEINDPDDALRAPRIAYADVRLLWYFDFWDYPITGMLAYRGEECWFEAVGEIIGVERRRFVVLRLTPEQYADEMYWHELFRAKVGWHTDYVDGVESLDQMLPAETRHEFYDAFQKRTPPDYSGCQVLAWFEL